MSPPAQVDNTIFITYYQLSLLKSVHCNKKFFWFVVANSFALLENGTEVPTTNQISFIKLTEHQGKGTFMTKYKITLEYCVP
jgi:hypothetical protein